MRSFPKAGTGESWAEVKQGHDEIFSKFTKLMTPEGLMLLAHHTSSAIDGTDKVAELPAEGPEEIRCVAVPAAALRTICYFAQSQIISALAEREAEHNAKQARAANQ